jgi:hypothetical protein
VKQLMNGSNRSVGVVCVEGELFAFGAHDESAALIGVNNQRNESRLGLQVGDDFQQGGMKEKGVIVGIDATGYDPD